MNNDLRTQVSHNHVESIFNHILEKDHSFTYVVITIKRDGVDSQPAMRATARPPQRLRPPRMRHAWSSQHAHRQWRTRREHLSQVVNDYGTPLPRHCAYRRWQLPHQSAQTLLHQEERHNPSASLCSDQRQQIKISAESVCALQMLFGGV